MSYLICSFLISNAELCSLPVVSLVQNVELYCFFATPSRQPGRGLKILVLEPCSEALRFSYILFSKLANLGSWSSLGLLGLQILVLEPCSEASRFSYILFSKPAISGC